MKPLRSVANVLTLLDERISTLVAERIALGHAAGRVLAGPITSSVNVPAFTRSAMDGYAVRSADLASPRSLRIIGQALPGQRFEGVVRANEAVRITTGAALPDGADSVVMVERTATDDEYVLVHDAIASGRNVIAIGEDVVLGRQVLQQGRVLRPQDIGLLAAIGVEKVDVVRSPRVAVLVTGRELVPVGMPLTGSQVTDSNSPMLAALLARDGGVLTEKHYLADDAPAIRNALVNAEADLVLITGGTSVGSEDHVARVVQDLGELAVHGVNIRPARPMGVGFVPRPVFLLPGNPIACLCSYDLFAGRAIRRLGGRSWELPYRRVMGPLLHRLESQVGRVDYARVKIVNGLVQVLAIGGASSLSSAVEADGFIVVPAGVDRIDAGEPVEVFCYD